MVKLLSIGWLVIVILTILSQYYIIEKKKIYPNKILWFIIRIIIAGGFLTYYIVLDYVWWKALSFMILSFWWPFNTTLNVLRRRYFTNLAPKNDPIDWLLIKITNGDVNAESNSGKNIMQEMMVSLLGLGTFGLVIRMMFFN